MRVKPESGSDQIVVLEQVNQFHLEPPLMLSRGSSCNTDVNGGEVSGSVGHDSSPFDVLLKHVSVPGPPPQPARVWPRTALCGAA